MNRHTNSLSKTVTRNTTLCTPTYVEKESDFQSLVSAISVRFLGYGEVDWVESQNTGAGRYTERFYNFEGYVSASAMLLNKGKRLKHAESE